MLRGKVHSLSCRFSLLHLVAGLGDPATLSFTLAYLHPNKVPGPGGVTPLHCAAIGESQECVKILLDHGADPIKPDDDGRTAYFWAKGSKADQDILKLLARGSKEASKSDEETKIPGGPEAEWGAFVEMTRDEQMKQVRNGALFKLKFCEFEIELQCIFSYLVLQLHSIEGSPYRWKHGRIVLKSLDLWVSFHFLIQMAVKQFPKWAIL